MNFCDNLKRARQRIGLTQQQIANALGVTKSTYCGYETGKRQPDIPKLRRLSLLLCTSVDELLSLSGGDSECTVTPKEFEQIKIFRALDAHGQRVVRMILEEEKIRVRTSMHETLMSASNEGTAILHVARQSISCESGVYLGPDGFDSIPVQRSALPPKTIFALRVEGRSMEPKFHDQDLLLISAESPRLGDIGVYMQSGLGYLRQTGFSELFYVNPAYPPIPLDDSLHSCGRVAGVLDAEDLL